MKWNDIHTTNNQSADPHTADAVVTHTNYLRFIAIGVVIIMVGIGIFFLVRALRNRTPQPLLPPEQLHQIGTFLDEHPPQPVTREEASSITHTVNQQVELNDADMQAIANFIQ